MSVMVNLDRLHTSASDFFKESCKQTIEGQRICIIKTAPYKDRYHVIPCTFSQN